MPSRQVKQGEKLPRPDPKQTPSWWSPPGTVKKVCDNCGFWFSSRGPGTCPECLRLLSKGKTPRPERRQAPKPI